MAVRQPSLAVANRWLLVLLIGEIALGLGLVVVAVACRVFGWGAGQRLLSTAVFLLFQVTYVANAAGALVSLLSFARTNDDQLKLADVAGHFLNWVYVVGLSWVFGMMLLMNGRD